MSGIAPRPRTRAPAVRCRARTWGRHPMKKHPGCPVRLPSAGRLALCVLGLAIASGGPVLAQSYRIDALTERVERLEGVLPALRQSAPTGRRACGGGRHPVRGHRGDPAVGARGADPQAGAADRIAGDRRTPRQVPARTHGGRYRTPAARPGAGEHVAGCRARHRSAPRTRRSSAAPPRRMPRRDRWARCG